MRIPLGGIFGRDKNNSVGSKSFVSKHPGMVLCLLLTLLVALLQINYASLFESYESRFIDYMFNIRGTIEPSGQVVMLEIDDKSIDHLGDWPWNHQVLAQMVEALHYYNPSSVVMHFPIEDRMDDFISGNSQLLAENILQSDNVILPFYPILSDRTPRTATAADWLRNSALISVVPFQAEETPRASRLEFPGELFVQAGKTMGANLTHFDANNRVRVQPLILRYEKLFYPSIELAAAAAANNIPLDVIEFDQDKMQVQIGMQAIPVDRRGFYMINYCGPASSIPSFSVKDFWDGEVDISKLQDKIVVVAVTASGLSDEIYTPFSHGFTPAEKSATVIDNMLSGRFITPLGLPSTARLIGLLVMGVLCSVLMPRIQLTHRYILLSLLAIGLISFSIIMFASYDTIVRIVHPALELILFALVAPMMTEHKKAHHVGQATSRVNTAARPATPSISKQSVNKTEMKEPDFEPGPRPVSEPIDTQNYQETSLPEEFDQEQLETKMMDSMANPTGETSRADVGEAVGGSSQSSQQVPSSDKMPRSFGRYAVIGRLGRGAMGTVYKGKDPAIDRLVALKTILLDKIADESEIDELRERLTREAKAAGSLSHPNIVTIYDVGQDGDTQYIAMEYLEGHTLEQIINRKLEFNLRLAAKIVFQVCSALSYAHRHGIVHRDIKPANIMVLENFHVKVMDFGIARFESSSLTQTGIAMGTPNYISPEQLKGEEVTLSSDIFSLGVVFYEMLTGRKPFVGDNISNLILKIINDNPPLPSTYSDKIPQMLDIIVKKALEKNPYDRYQSAEEMMRTLEDFAMGFSSSRTRL